MKQEYRPKAGEFYRHFKNKYYQIISVAKHTETEEELVIYQALYGEFQIYARPLEMFLSEVDKEKYPEAQQKYRFERIEKIPVQENAPRFIQQEEKQKEEMIQERKEITIQDKLMDFLDADSYKEKLNLLQGMKKQIDDKMINDMAVVLDIVIEDGELDKRIEALERCLKTLIKFECNRLR